MTASNGRPAVLKNRSFLLLWSAQAVSQTAQNVVLFLLLIAVEARGHSSTLSSLIVLSFIVPAVLFGPLAGVFVDRTDKRTMLVITNLLRAGLVLVYMLIDPDWPDAVALTAIYLLSFAFATISQFFAPAEASTIPLLVDKEQLSAANSLFSLTYNASQIVGFAFLGPLMITFLAPATIFFDVSALYFVCALLVGLLPRLIEGVRPMEQRVGETTVSRMFQDIQEIGHFIVGLPVIATAIIDLAITTSIFLMLGTLGVGLLTRVMGLPASSLSYVLVAGGTGLLVGLVLAPRLFRRVNGGLLIEVGLFAMGACILAMAIVNPLSDLLFAALGYQARVDLVLIAVMFLAAVLGLGSALVTIPANTMLQQWSPPSIRGRVFGTLFAITSALSILPVLFSGALADIFGLQKVLALIGIVTLAVAIITRGRQRSAEA